MQFAQLFGQPIRWAEYAAGDATAKAEIVQMMQRVGTEAWGIFPVGTKLNFVETGKSAASLPQHEMLKLADEQCEVFILGQTLTSSQGDRGSQSLGTVHMEVRQEVIEGVCDFVGEVFSYQFVPAYIDLNYGEARPDAPGIWAVFEEAKDEKALAERDRILVKEIGMPVGKAWLYERHGVPMPAAGEEVFEPAPPPADPATDPDADPQRPGKPAPGKKPDPKGVEAGDVGGKWLKFAPESGTLGIPRAEMPQIRAENRGAMVSFLRARGVDSRAEEVNAVTLRPTQAEYSPAKVTTAAASTGGQRSILVSQEGHVVDGHHQWLAAMESSPYERIRIIRLMAPIRDVLAAVRSMPSATVEVTAAAASVDQLSANVLEGLTGVTREWLSPVRPFFDRLAALSLAHQVTDDDVLAALQKSRCQLPELFDVLDTRALQNAFEDAIGSALLDGSSNRYE